MEYSHEPKDMYHSHNGYISSGLLTPSTSAYEGRRDSIASAQSSISYAQSYGSGSFYSPKMPPTPTSQRDPVTEDFTFVHGHSGFDGTIPTSGDDFNFGECHTEVPVSLSQPIRGVESNSPFTQDWVYVEQQQQHQYPIRQDRLQSIEGLPAAGDLPSAFNALLGSCSGQTPISSTMDALPASSSWLHASSMVSAHGLPNVGPHDLGYSYAPPPSLSSSVHATEWPSTSSGQVFQCLGAPETIRPEHSVFDMDDGSSYMPTSSDSFDESLQSYDSCSSPTLHSQHDAFLGMGTDGYQEVKREESDFDESEEKLYRSIHVSPTGGKGVKKERRNSGVGKKKSRVGKHKSFVSKLKEGNVQVDLDGDFERDENGKYYRLDGQSTKKLECKLAGCGKKFLRPEHLKRHQNTHNGSQDYHCPLLFPRGDKPCEKAFNRNDNCQAHVWTHVERPENKAMRNKRYPLAQVIEMIRQASAAKGQSPEEAEKLISFLRNKMAGELKGGKREE